MKLTIEELISSKDPSQLTSAEKINIKNLILETLTDESTDIYLDILTAYLNEKRKKKLTTKEIADLSGLPELTIKRFENLQTIPTTMNFIKILKSLNLNLIVK